MRIKGGIRLDGINFQQFLKNKMATTANFPQIFALLSLIHQHLVSHLVNFLECSMSGLCVCLCVRSFVEF